jgi:MFS family permease
MFSSLKRIYEEYPRKFWVLIGVYFIDRVGGSLIYPFLSLYITGKFGVGMTQVGVMLAIHSVSAFIGNLLGGALTDRFGRKSMLIVGLVSSASVSLSMGLVQDWTIFYLLVSLTGFLSHIGDPAASAMMADILPIEKRTDGYGVLRVAVNLAVTIGPAIGGLMAGVSYLLLFVMDCVVSGIAAIIVFFSLPETKPEIPEGEIQASTLQTIKGYGIVFKDRLLLVIIVLTMFTAIVYLQINSSLSVYLRDLHGISAQQFGYILSLNAIMVVVMQFSITKQVKKFQPLWMMALGNVLYAGGFAMYGFVSGYPAFLFAMVIVTLGEMVIAPVIQTVVAFIAPHDMRGRYMAAFQIGRQSAAAIGPLVAGVILDHYNPHWLWYGGGLICVTVAAGYLVLNKRAGTQFNARTNLEGKAVERATG